MATVSIGIDLGSSSCRVAAFMNERANVIANAGGDRETPTSVAFSETETLVGTASQAQEHRNQKNTFTGFTSVLGLAPGTAGYESAKKLLGTAPQSDGTFSVDAKKDKPAVSTNAEELTSHLVQSLKETAEAFLGHRPTSCVVTVPASFSAEQRQAVVRACASKKLAVAQIVAAPLAAAVALDLTRGSDLVTGAPTPDRNVMFIDIGLRMEISVVKISGGLASIASTKAYPDIGGALFDEVLVEHFAGEFKRKTGLDLKESKRALTNLRNASRLAKIALSSSQQGAVAIDSLYEGADFHSTVNRGRFEGIAGPVITKIVDTVDAYLSDHKLELDDITDFVLLGGCCRIPKLQADLAAFFELEPLPAAVAINSDEIAVSGAAVQGHFVSTFGTRHGSQEAKKKSEEAATTPEATNAKISGATLTETVTSASLGVSRKDGSFIALVPKGSPLPALMELNIPLSDLPLGPSSVTIELFVGEDEKASSNKKVAKIGAKIGQAANKVARINASVALDGTVTLKVIAAGGEAQNATIPV